MTKEFVTSTNVTNSFATSTRLRGEENYARQESNRPASGILPGGISRCNLDSSVVVRESRAERDFIQLTYRPAPDGDPQPFWFSKKQRVAAEVRLSELQTNWSELSDTVVGSIASRTDRLAQEAKSAARIDGEYRFIHIRHDSVVMFRSKLNATVCSGFEGIDIPLLFRLAGPFNLIGHYGTLPVRPKVDGTINGDTAINVTKRLF